MDILIWIPISLAIIAIITYVVVQIKFSNDNKKLIEKIVNDRNKLIKSL